MVRFRTRGRGRGRRIYPIRGGYGSRQRFPSCTPRPSSFTQAFPPYHRRSPLTPSDGVRRYLSLDSSSERIENEVLAYVSSEFGQDIAAAAKPIISAAIRTRPGIRPGVGVEPVIQLEDRGTEHRGTVGLDFPVDLSPLPMGQIVTQLVGEPKFYVRLEVRVRVTPKQFRLKMLDARVGFSMQPIGSDNAKDIYWGKSFRP